MRQGWEWRENRQKRKQNERKENHSLTNLGTVSQLEDTFHGVDSDDDRFWAQLRPRNVDPQLVNMATHERKRQF